MRLSEYDKIQGLSNADVFILDTSAGTKTIMAIDLAKALLGLASSDDILEGIDLSELSEVTVPNKDDVLLIGTENGNQQLPLSDAIFKLIDPVISVEARRNIWRGKNLGALVTPEQLDQIDLGTFRDLFLGDYWEIGDRIWRIVDFDYWMGTGDQGSECTTHHLVIMPDHVLYNAKMNDTNITTGGYMGSKMYTENIANAKTLVNGAFGASHVLNHRELLTNAVTNGYASAGAWVNSTVELPNEVMMYGSYQLTPANNGVNVPYRYTIDKTQLAAMKAHPKLINPHRENQWLRDVVSATSFAFVNSDGRSSSNNASYAFEVRVVFGLKK